MNNLMSITGSGLIVTFPSQGGHVPTMEGQPGLPCPLSPYPKPWFWAATSDCGGTSPGLLAAPRQGRG